MTDQRVFPIVSDTACVLKWAWSTIYLGQGTTASCHRVKQHPIDPNNFANFHNQVEKIQARELMLAGQWPQAGCQYCEKIEAAGGMSDRLYQLTNEQNAERIPQELFADPTTTAVVPTILEIYFNNTCNMSCVYCGSWFSSQWTDENRRFGRFEKDGVVIGHNKPENIDYQRMLADFWKYLGKHYRSMLYFQILGGEPFYQKEFDTCLEFWEQHPNPDLAFNIITNLKVAPKRFRAYIDRFEQLVNNGSINRLQITGSLDAWGPQEEYVRWGLNLAEWQENFEYLVNKPWITLTINAAITGLTIKAMPELLERINHWNSQRLDPIYFSFMSVVHPPQLMPDIFGAGVFEEDFDHILALMPDDHTREHMAGIAQQIKSAPRNSAGINQLKVYLTELDRRRGTDWQQTFPWLKVCF